MSRAATCIATIALIFCMPSFAQEDESFSSGAGQDKQFALDQSAVVVLPVDVLSNESRYSELADLVYRKLLRQIAAIDGIHVIDPTLVAPFSGSEITPSEIGKLLGVATVVRSRVHAGEPGYSIRIECIDAHNGKPLFSWGTHSYVNWEAESGEDKAINYNIVKTVETLEHKLFPARRSDRENESDIARMTFLDSRLGEKERVQALNDLRPPTSSGYPQQYIDGGIALSGDVAIVATQIVSESRHAGVRAGIWYIMTGVPDPVLIQPLIHSLGNDTVALVRERAASALAAHNEDLGVQAALEIAGTNDPDLGVRHAAQLAASTQAGRRELLRQAIMDADLPERERRRAMFHYSQINGDGVSVPIDDALTEAMVMLAQTASEVRTRQSAWFNLGNMAGPNVAEDLIDALTDEPSETVREWVVYALERKIDVPGVRSALENAQRNDLSPLVRSASDRVMRGENH